MKINRSASSNNISNQNMKQSEQKETISRTDTYRVDRFENSKNEALPSRNDAIGGGHQRKEIPKSENSKPGEGTTSESQPETPAWLKGKEHGRGISWGKDVRPNESSGTSIGNSGDKGEKVNLDYFDKQKRIKELIVADENSLKNMDKGDGTKPGESKEPGRKNPIEGMEGGVPRGYGKNKSSKQEQASMFGNFPVFQGSNTGSTGSGPTPYPAAKAETSSPSSTVLTNVPKENASTTTPASKGDEQGTLKGMVSSTSMQNTSFIMFFSGPTRTGNRTPTPDAVEESHIPKGILAEEKTARKDLATNHDKVELHDENKRQQEKVYVERQEIFGGMVARKTDGRSTPTPTDGTTDSQGPRQSTGTGGVDLESKHRKGDPGDGDEA